MLDRNRSIAFGSMVTVHGAITAGLATSAQSWAGLMGIGGTRNSTPPANAAKYSCQRVTARSNEVGQF
jgi:hypothetical protein